MDLNPKQQAFWRFLSLTVCNIQIESTRANPDLRRLVVLINTLDANIVRSAGSRLPDNNFEVTTQECNDQDHKRSPTDHDGVSVSDNADYDGADDLDSHQGLPDAESPNGANDLSQSDWNTSQACLSPKHRHTGDSTTWQAYRVPACFALPPIVEDDEEDKSNAHGPVKAIDARRAARKCYYWSNEKAACCYVSIEEVSEVGELCF